MNNNSIDALSLQITQYQLPGFCFWIIIGVITIITNSLTTFTIINSKSLHTKSMCILANYATSDCFAGLAFLVQGSKKLYLVLNYIPETNTQLNCLLWSASTS